MNNTNFKTFKTTITLVLLLVCNYTFAQTYPLSDEALAAKIAAKEQITDVFLCVLTPVRCIKTLRLATRDLSQTH